MSELQQIVAAANAARERGADAVLATVVRVSGSTYRRPGARMLLTRDGERVGAISGGCLERELQQRAAWRTQAGRPTVVRYDTASGDDAVGEFGLGCQGVVWVLLERLRSTPAASLMSFADDCLRERRAGWVATVVAAEGDAGAAAGDRWCATDDAFGDARFLGGAADAPGRWLTSDGALRQYATSRGTLEVFVERLEPTPQLVIFGAGHDAAALVRLAAETGYAVAVIDRRAAYAVPGRFPRATRVVACPSTGVPAAVSLDAYTHAVVMTHNAYDDAAFLKVLLPSAVGYIGLLGPRPRAAAVLETLAAEGVHVSAVRGERLFAPVGLDIGAETPVEIALAILAELQACRAGRSGGSLRAAPGPIHAPRGLDPAATSLLDPPHARRGGAPCPVALPS